MTDKRLELLKKMLENKSKRTREKQKEIYEANSKINVKKRD